MRKALQHEVLVELKQVHNYRELRVWPPKGPTSGTGEFEFAAVRREVKTKFLLHALFNLHRSLNERDFRNGGAFD
jgi:hypothetical protein